ncbi:MAG: FAD-dependent oxidoreductase, partial [Clostridia bacterium]|nr:FAD-dependent oxidoreductase [Clostridia bacterium]
YEPLCDGRGKKMVAGIGEELIKLSVKYGFDCLPESWGGEGKNQSPSYRYSTFYSPMTFSLALDEYVRESGADIRFDTLASYPVMDGNTCLGIMAETVSGKEFYPAKMVIDATGDASVCHRAGMPTMDGTNALVYVSHGFGKEQLEAYDSEKDLLEFRKWNWVGKTGDPDDDVLEDSSGTTSDSVNEFIRKGKKGTFNLVKANGKYDYELSSIPTMPQFRTIRHIVGDTMLDGSEDGRTDCPDSVGCFSDFRKPNTHYQLPYSTLCNKRFPNILAAGRIISAHGEGWQVTRVIPVCALTGQVAGTAAAQAIKTNTEVNDIDLDALRKTLKDNDCILEF